MDVSVISAAKDTPSKDDSSVSMIDANAEDFTQTQFDERDVDME